MDEIKSNQNILKFINCKSLILFRNFNSNNTETCNEDLVVYDFMLKIHKENCSVDLYYVIKYIFDNKLKNLLNFVTNEKSDLFEKYNKITDPFAFSSKEPYSLFINNNTKDPKIISRKLEICLQVLFNYLYYIVYKIEKEKLPENHPKSIKQAINKIDKSTSITQNCFYLLNSFFRFFKQLSKATKFLIRDNESIIEIYLILICLQNEFDNKFLHRSKKLLKYFNIKKTIQTSIMLINLNKEKFVITKGISNILTYLLYFNHNYIMILIDIFNDSNFNLDHCAILIKKIILSIPSHVNKDEYYRRLINYFVSFIISKVDDEISEGIKVFMVDLLNSAITKFSDDYKFSLILFDILFSKLYSKFQYKIIISSDNLQFEKIEYKTKEKITQRQVKFIKFLIDNFNVSIKSKFSKIVANSEFIKINLKILFKLWNKSSFYYDNIENENLKTLQTFFSLILENVENSNLASQTVKFLTNSVFKDAQKFDTTFSDFDLDLEDLNINHIKFTQVYFIHYISTFEYSLYCQNFIENIFKTLPFKNIVNDVLNMFLSGKITLKDDLKIDVDLFLFNLENSVHVLYSREELQTNLIKINNLSKIIKHKLLITLLTLVSDFNDILSVENSLRLLTFILSQNYEDLDIHLSCTKIIITRLKEEKLKSFQLTKNILEFLPLVEQLSESNSEYSQVYLDLKEILDNSSITMEETEKVTNKIDLNKVYVYLFEAEKILSNIDKSYKLKEVNNLLVKSILGNSNLSKEWIKNMFNLILKVYKICEIHISKICQKLFVNLFEIILNTDENQISFFFNLIFTNIIENANRPIEDQELISLENQSSLKLIEIVDRIIKRNKYACVLFMNEINQNIFILFDNYYNKLNPIFISSLMSVLAKLVNYCPYEMSKYLSTLIKTCFNHLKIESCDKEIKRSSALVLFKIIQNCDFLNYKDFAREIYETITRSFENSKDKVLRFHLGQCIKLIKEYLEEFYKIE